MRVLIRYERFDLLLRRKRATARRRQEPHAGYPRCKQLSRHPQMQQQATTVVQVRDKVLSATFQAFTGAPDKLPTQHTRRREKKVTRLGRDHFGDPPPLEERCDLTPRGFDFWQLRHAAV